MRMVKCPTCRTLVPWQGNPYRPFCSARCRTIDLGAWADESYRIAGERVEEGIDQHQESFPQPGERRGA
ncbi:MAG TPA: DNA gyrase inhibitor YacG [Methylomirabilota bacterium]|jgi:endogenous inhibitor of DNA gyrase (YacG/DUF329 family)|nr:DNA gyrase inhibitor YacG [Methylomirabilota bacterium]